MPITHVSQQPNPINLHTSFIGPVVPLVKPEREQFEHRLNETASLVDHVFNKTINFKTLDEAKVIIDPAQLIKNYKVMLNEHVDRRIVIFLQQLFACYGTRLHFEVGFTEHQGHSATALKINIKNKLYQTCKRNSAHSSTFPNLWAYSQSEWDHYRKNGGNKPQGFVFLKGSDLYRGMNATIEFPREVNDADIALDSNHHDSLFSQKALELLNQVSLGQIYPPQGITIFVNSALVQLDLALSKSSKTGVLASLEIYKKKFTKVKNEISQNDNWVFTHLNICLNHYAPSDKQKAMMLKISCQSIRSHLMKQAEIAQLIDRVKQSIFSAIKANSRVVKLEDCFRYAIIENMATPEDKIRMSNSLHYLKILLFLLKLKKK